MQNRMDTREKNIDAEKKRIDKQVKDMSALNATEMALKWQAQKEN